MKTPSVFKHLVRNDKDVYWARPAWRSFLPSIFFIVLVAAANVAAPQLLKVGLGFDYLGVGAVQWLTIMGAAYALVRIAMKRHLSRFEVEVQEEKIQILTWKGLAPFETSRSLPESGVEFSFDYSFPMGWIFNYGNVSMRYIDRETGATWKNVANPSTIEKWIRHIYHGGLVESHATSDSDELYTVAEHENVFELKASNVKSVSLTKEYFSKLPPAKSPLNSADESPLGSDEKWCIAAEWDASQNVTKRDGSQRANPPRIVTWSPCGETLATSCDGFNVKLWTLAGESVGGGNRSGAYCDSESIFWSPDGKLLLKTGRSHVSIKNWWTISDKLGNILGDFIPYAWLHKCVHVELDQYFSPFRPHRNQFLVVKSVGTQGDGGTRDQVLNLYNTENLPQTHLKDRKSKTLMSRLYPKLSDEWLTSVKPSMTLMLGDRQVERFDWHPSGNFLALTARTTSDNSQQVLIVDFEKATIIGEVPSCAIGMKWSQCGRYFAFVEHINRHEDNCQRRTLLWDGSVLEAREATIEEMQQPWLKRLFNYDLDTSRGWFSCDARRKLEQDRGSDRSLVILNCDNKEVVTHVTEGFGVSDAAWSPTDPSCFVTVGGPEANNLLRIWRRV